MNYNWPPVVPVCGMQNDHTQVVDAVEVFITPVSFRGHYLCSVLTPNFDSGNQPGGTQEANWGVEI